MAKPLQNICPAGALKPAFKLFKLARPKPAIPTPPAIRRIGALIRSPNIFSKRLYWRRQLPTKSGNTPKVVKAFFQLNWDKGIVLLQSESAGGMISTSNSWPVCAASTVKIHDFLLLLITQCMASSVIKKPTFQHVIHQAEVPHSLSYVVCLISNSKWSTALAALLDEQSNDLGP